MATLIVYPTGDSATSGRNQMTPSSGSDKWAMVDDTHGAPNESDYVEAVGDGLAQYFTFAAPSIPAGSTGITVGFVFHEMTGGGSGVQLVAHALRIGGATYSPTSSTVTDQAWATRTTTPLTDNPRTVAPWTVDDINGVGGNAIQEFGCRNAGTSGAEFYRCAQCLMVIEYTPPDTTAPTLSVPTATETGPTTASLGVTTNEGNGTLYCVLTASASAPSASQVKSGQDHTGSSALFSDSQSISSSGAKSFNATGLTPETTYYAHFMHEDAATNQSSVASSDSFATDEESEPGGGAVVVSHLYRQMMMGA